VTKKTRNKKRNEWNSVEVPGNNYNTNGKEKKKTMSTVN
jgi:hypothetical protein